MSRSAGPPREATAIVLGSDVTGSAVAQALHRAQWDVVLIDEIDPPGPWRGMSFVNAWYLGSSELQGVAACFCSSVKSIPLVLRRQNLIAATSWSWAGVTAALHADVLIDTRRADGGGPPDALLRRAPEGLLTIGCGPSLECGEHVHIAVETSYRAPGRVLRAGGTSPQIGDPPALAGRGLERFLRAPRTGRMRTLLRIGDAVQAREAVGDVNGEPVFAAVSGVLRGLSARGARITEGQIIAEVDPRGDAALCYGLDARCAAVAAGVMEALQGQRFSAVPHAALAAAVGAADRR